MDNDDLRRGRPTAHKMFDEATAILAGDGLLTFAFDILSRPETHPDAAVRVSLVNLLARASGIGGMAGGQMLDLAAEGRFADKPQSFSEEDVRVLQAMKTGALLHFACLAGAVLGNARGAERDALDRYGLAVGRAFQIADDLLDVEGDAATVGKQTGKDRGRLIEHPVCGRTPAAQVVVVHRRQIVVHQRVAMNAFERGAGEQRLYAWDIEQCGGLRHQKRTHAFAAAEAGIAHGFEQALRPRDLTGDRRRLQQPVEQRFGVPGGGVEPRGEGGADGLIEHCGYTHIYIVPGRRRPPHYGAPGAKGEAVSAAHFLSYL
jgi:hypothetical protein